MFKRIRNKILEKVKDEIYIPKDEGKVIFDANKKVPHVYFKIKIINQTEVKLIPQKLFSWVYLGTDEIGQIRWDKDDPIKHVIMDIPPKRDFDYQLFYLLQSVQNIEKDKLWLKGTITFGTQFGIITKNFEKYYSTKTKEWQEKIKIWRSI